MPRSQLTALVICAVFFGTTSGASAGDSGRRLPYKVDVEGLSNVDRTTIEAKLKSRIDAANQQIKKAETSKRSAADIKRLAGNLQAEITAEARKLAKELNLPDETEVVAIAEKFIREQGYTAQTGDKSKLVSESIEWYSNPNKTLEFRHDTLKPKAYGVCPPSKKEPWLVIFQYKNPQTSSNTGRAVTVSLDGKNIDVAHCDFFLKAVTKKF